MKRKKNSFRGIKLPFLFLFLLLFPLQAFSQNFPTKPIIIYCGFEAGGATDLTARALAEAAQKELKVPVVVENKPGGGTTVAATLIASQKPDGYTLAAISSGALETRHLMLQVPYDPFKDFTNILAYAYYIGGIVVRNDSPFKTLQDLLEHARKNPGALSYSSSGIGGPPQLAIEYLAMQAKVSFKHVPFKGAAPAITALIGGHVDFNQGGGLHVTYVKQGVCRILAVTNTEERDPAFPDVPTLKDLGYKDMPPALYLLVGPKGMPDPIFKVVEEGFRKSAHSPGFREFLNKLGVPFSFRDRRQLEADFPGRYKFYADFLKEIGITKEKTK